MVSLGDAKDLLILGVQVVSFINDMRYAQDSFNSLRAEAQCLQICINSLASGPCQDALYHYMSPEQRKDLRSIIQNTKLNMKDLNDFLTDCKALVKKDAKKRAKKRALFDKWKDFMKQAWAAFRFTLTDPQPFRNKLALPTASINVFLTSMTHVGLTNVGRLMSLSGHGVVLAGAGASSSSSSGQRGLDGWESVGQKVAFRRLNVGLTDLEDEIVRYAMHLAGGGNVFDATDDSLAMVRSPSRDKEGRYMVRRKTTVYPGSHTKQSTYIQQVGRRESLGLVVPGTPVSPGSPRIIEAEPAFVHTERRASASYSRSHSEDARSPARSPSRESAGVWERKAFEKKMKEKDEELDVGAFRQRAMAEIQAEMEASERAAEAELRSKMSSMRQTRRSHRMSYESRQSARPSKESEGKYMVDEDGPALHAMPIDSDSDSEDDIIDLLEREYGLVVERVDVPRDPVDNGTVAVTVPSTLVAPEEVSPPVPETEPPKPTRSSRLKQETSVLEGPRRPAYRQSSHYQPYTRGSRYRTSSGHDRYGADEMSYGRKISELRPYHEDERYGEFVVRENSLKRPQEYERRRARQQSNPDIIIHNYDATFGSDSDDSDEREPKRSEGRTVKFVQPAPESSTRGTVLRRSASDRGPQPSVSRTSDGYVVRRKKNDK